MDQLLDFITGPNGGVVAFAFGTGFAIGYSFAQRTIVRQANERIDGANKRIAHLEEEVARLNKEMRDILSGKS